MLAEVLLVSPLIVAEFKTDHVYKVPAGTISPPPLIGDSIVELPLHTDNVFALTLGRAFMVNGIGTWLLVHPFVVVVAL